MVVKLPLERKSEKGIVVKKKRKKRKQTKLDPVGPHPE